jgi:thioredoxin-related protein
MSSEINWQPDWDAALTDAQASQKPILLELYMNGCGHCAHLHKETHPDPQVIAAVNAKFIAVRLEGPSHMDLIKKYEVRGAPTTIIFSADGKELHRFAGFFPPTEYLQELAKIS